VKLITVQKAATTRLGAQPAMSATATTKRSEPHARHRRTAAQRHHAAMPSDGGSGHRTLVAPAFDDASHDVLADRSLADLLADHVRAQPDATAVIHEDDALSYRELARRSSDLAVYLRRLGVRVDHCVGLFVEPSIDLMVGAWGILLSGGAYLPLSPEYPEDRLRYMIEDSGADVIVCQDALKARLAALAPDSTLVTPADAARFARSVAAHDEPTLAARARPHDLAYVIYTSGSTGRPKGVAIEHRSIVNQMHWLSTAYALNRDRVVLQKTPMSFDAAQWEILAPSCGSTVVMGSPGVYRDPERLVDAIATHGVTTLQCVPTLLQALLDTDRLHACRSLQQIFSGGEALTRTLALHCIETLPECALVNLYGPTECTINTSAFTVDPATVADGADTIPIGAPVYNTRYHILDERRSPVAVGEIGELHVSGVQLARGYLRRPDLTDAAFVANPFTADHRHRRLYRTGDLAYWNADGTVQFAGRADNQVKLRGFRVELEEIRLAIEAHGWVKNAPVVVRTDPRTGFQNLVAFVELNPKEAALMDQGSHGAHHQSKESKLQVKAQLANMGCRDADEISGRAVVDLPGAVPTQEQRRRVFARKTYRFFEGGEVTRADILRALGRRVSNAGSRGLETVSLADLGEMLRYFGQYASRERLLPKYGYASPGSLYATQMYLELDGIGGLEPGCYYYHPLRHQLIRIKDMAGGGSACVKVHFVGKRRAIEPVYNTNVEEVLEIEAGHMVGLFEEILPGYGLTIAALEHEPAAKDHVECADEDHYLGTFAIVPYAGRPAESSDVYVQAHPGGVADLPAGLYRHRDGALERISDELVLQRHVIAINQQVYERSCFGITVVSHGHEKWMSYIDLGRKLQHLSMNDGELGFMSAGYSSKTGNDLPSAKAIAAILEACGEDSGPSYFFVGGRVSDAQVRSEGMKEDVVHMKGPAEMIRDDLTRLLPKYMIPNRIVVLDELPLTANGKIDVKALAASDAASAPSADRPFVAPRTETEERVRALWAHAMKRDGASVRDDFFESGGNSLIAVGLVNRINEAFAASLPLQVVFEAPTIEKLARRLDEQSEPPASRLVALHAEGSKSPVYCWPGLGGYTMNLRSLASTIGIDRPFYGVQAHGINDGEHPFATIREMAAEDCRMIQRRQPVGPYTLWGYSFGARVAFETAYQLERSGQRVESLFLIAPGSPSVRAAGERGDDREASYDDEAYVTILFSVFAGSVTGPVLAECLAATEDEESFASFISERFEPLDVALVKRIMRIVQQTYEFKYAFAELAERQIKAPMTIFKARGDDYSFIESSSGYSSQPPAVVELDADHYGMLRDPGIGELVTMLRQTARVPAPQACTPHESLTNRRPACRTSTS
jgi:amino acid adenylation domain-containing protein